MTLFLRRVLFVAASLPFAYLLAFLLVSLLGDSWIWAMAAASALPNGAIVLVFLAHKELLDYDDRPGQTLRRILS